MTGIKLCAAASLRLPRELCVPQREWLTATQRSSEGLLFNDCRQRSATRSAWLLACAPGLPLCKASR